MTLSPFANCAGTPVDLSTEPGRSGTTSAVGGASTGEANTKKSQDAIIDSTGIQPLAGGNAAKKPVTTPKTFKKSSDEDPLWQKVHRHNARSKFWSPSTDSTLEGMLKLASGLWSLLHARSDITLRMAML